MCVDWIRIKTCVFFFFVKCSRKSEREKINRHRTYFFVVFDFIFFDDAVGLLGLQPGELDAALLHLLVDDLPDLGWSCRDRNTALSGPLLHQHPHVIVSSSFQSKRLESSQPNTEAIVFSSINSSISRGERRCELMAESPCEGAGRAHLTS